jgi:transcriptional regulator GlxA family with amidase domain
MRYLLKQLGGTKAVTQMLRISQRTVERYVKDQIKKSPAQTSPRVRSAR